MTAPTFTRAGLEASGFTGWVTMRNLERFRSETLDRRRWSVRPEAIVPPDAAGVYLVWRTATGTPSFLAANPGGRFKHKDPTVDRDILKLKWVRNAQVLYLGKAADQTLRSRVGQLIDFASGRPIGHWGGRYLWQVKGVERLLVAWLLDPNATTRENALLTSFQVAYRSLPFANIAGPRGTDPVKAR